MEQEKLIKRINELAKFAKERELTKQEQEERAELRKLYLENFKKGFTQHLENIKVVDENGNQIDLKNRKE